MERNIIRNILALIAGVLPACGCQSPPAPNTNNRSSARLLPGSEVDLPTAAALSDLVALGRVAWLRVDPGAPGQSHCLVLIEQANALKAECETELLVRCTVNSTWTGEEEPRIGSTYIFYLRNDGRPRPKAVKIIPRTLEAFQATQRALAATTRTGAE